MKFKTQKIFGVLFFAVFFFIFSASIATEEKGSEELQKLKAFKAAYPTTSKDYRGVVAIDANGGCADELYCDFGSNGLWMCEAGTWTKLNATDPDWIIGFEESGTEYLLCDFGSAGLWYWQYGVGPPGQFVKITSSDPGSGFATDDDNDGDDEVYLSFGGNGLWRYDKGNATILTKIHATTPTMSNSLRSDLWAAGHEEAALDFGTGVGLWTTWWNGNWTKINASTSEDDNASADFNAADTPEELIIDFGTGTGLWAYDGYNWYMLSSSDPYDAVAVYLPSNADYELLVHFGGVTGLWVWDYGTGYPGIWTQISSNTADWDGGFCEPFDPNNDGWEEVAIDFASNGLWIFDNGAGTTWTKINASDPEFMIRSNYYCDGYDTALVVDFGSAGLWIYRGLLGTWTKLSTFSPDGVN